MKHKKLIIPSIIVTVILAVFLLNPLVTCRFFTPESCTLSQPSSHFLIINYAKGESWANKEVVSEGWYVICMSHPDCKAYGCVTENCYDDNGTYVLVGDRFTMYDGSFYDRTEWHLKSEYIGILISDFTLGATEIIYWSILVSVFIGLLLWLCLCVFKKDSSNGVQK